MGRTSRIGGVVVTSRGVIRVGDTVFWEYGYGFFIFSFIRVFLGVAFKLGFYR